MVLSSFACTLEHQSRPISEEIRSRKTSRGSLRCNEQRLCRLAIITLRFIFSSSNESTRNPKLVMIPPKRMMTMKTMSHRQRRALKRQPHTKLRCQRRPSLLVKQREAEVVNVQRRRICRSTTNVTRKSTMKKHPHPSRLQQRARVLLKRTRRPKKRNTKTSVSDRSLSTVRCYRILSQVTTTMLKTMRNHRISKPRPNPAENPLKKRKLKTLIMRMVRLARTYPSGIDTHRVFIQR